MREFCGPAARRGSAARPAAQGSCVAPVRLLAVQVWGSAGGARKSPGRCVSVFCGHPKPRHGAPAPYPPPEHTLVGSRAELQRPQRPNSRAVRAGVGRCQNGGVPTHPPLALATTTTLAQKVCRERRPNFVSRSQACQALAPQSFGRALCTLFFLCTLKYLKLDLAPNYVSRAWYSEY